MYCINCQQPIDTQRSGFVVCPNCSTVNIAGISPESPTANQTALPNNTTVTAPQKNKRGKKRHIVAAGVISLTALLILVPSITFGLQQQKSSSIIKTAQSLTQKGRYKNAASELESAQKLWALPSTKKQIERSLADNQRWVKDAAQLETAKRLIAQGKFQEAQKALQSIKADYPRFKDVKNLIQSAKNKQDAAIKAEQARKAMELKAQADAIQAASQSSKAANTAKTKSSTQAAAKPANQTGFPIAIRGDATCISQTQQALNLLQTKAPDHYANIIKYMGIIECAPSGSGMYAWENPPRYVVGDATRNAGTIWYAGTIAHDAGHSRLYHEYQASHPGQAVPDSVWTGQAAEATCLAAQADALRKIGASQSTIDYVNNVISTGYYNVPLADRWW